MGELFYGALRSTKREDELNRIGDFALNCGVLNCDTESARVYARIKNGLAAKGKLIPENDLWIAAQAIQHGVTLATADEHFESVEGLLIERW